MNKFICIGRLSKDVDLRYTLSNVAVASFDIAVNRKYSDKDGNRIADFFRVIVWRNQAENVKKYCKKGSMVAVEGEVQNRSYEDRDGVKRYITEIMAERIVFLTQKEKTEEQHEEEPQPSNVTDDSVYAEFGEENSNPFELTDDDLPF